MVRREQERGYQEVGVSHRPEERPPIRNKNLRPCGALVAHAWSPRDGRTRGLFRAIFGYISNWRPA